MNKNGIEAVVVVITAVVLVGLWVMRSGQTRPGGRDFDCTAPPAAPSSLTYTKSGDVDYTACSVWGVFQHEEKGYALLLDCWQEQLGMPDLIKRVKKEMNTAYGDDQDETFRKAI